MPCRLSSRLNRPSHIHVSRISNHFPRPDVLAASNTLTRGHCLPSILSTTPFSQNYTFLRRIGSSPLLCLPTAISRIPRISRFISSRVLFICTRRSSMYVVCRLIYSPTNAAQLEFPTVSCEVLYRVFVLLRLIRHCRQADISGIVRDISSVIRDPFYLPSSPTGYSSMYTLRLRIS